MLPSALCLCEISVTSNESIAIQGNNVPSTSQKVPFTGLSEAAAGILKWAV